MTKLAKASIVVGIIAYVSAWFNLVEGDYFTALAQAVGMFVLFILASHDTDLDTA